MSRQVRNANVDDTDNSTATATTLPRNYTPFWSDPDIRLIGRLIFITSLFLILFDIGVVVLWALRLIPSIPPSFLFYGFIWYTVFIFTGILTLFISCSRNQVIYTITLIILFVALLVIVFLNIIIINQIVQCLLGNLETSCTNFIFTQFLLEGLSLLIGLCILILFGLFLVMVIRLTRVYSTKTNNLY